MSEYSPWGALSQLQGIQLEFTDIATDELGWWDPERNVITLAKNQSRREMRCTLQHELEHALAGDEDVSHVSPVLAARQEIAACMRAAQRLISLDALIDALLWSQDERELAEVLNVDEDTVRIRLLTLSSEEHTIIDCRIRMAERGIA